MVWDEACVDIFLSCLGRLKPDLMGLTRRAFSCVDDYLVFVDTNNCTKSLVDTAKVFEDKRHGLSFTCEAAKDNTLQFIYCFL